MIKICGFVFIVFAINGLSGGANAAAKCPARDVVVCKFSTVADKNNELIILRNVDDYVIKNGKFYGAIAKRASAAPLGDATWSGGGQIYDVKEKPLEKKYWFVEMSGFDEKTDLDVILKKSKVGIVSFFPETHMGWYEFANAPKVGLLCEEKYFAQLDPKHPSSKYTEDEACQMMSGEEAPGSTVRPTVPSNALGPFKTKNKKR